jgi:hypothetical protein
MRSDDTPFLPHRSQCTAPGRAALKQVCFSRERPRDGITCARGCRHEMSRRLLRNRLKAG